MTQIKESKRRVYVLQTREHDPVPMVFADRATAHAWAEANIPHDRWHVTDFPVWT